MRRLPAYIAAAAIAFTAGVASTEVPDRWPAPSGGGQRDSQPAPLPARREQAPVDYCDIIREPWRHSGEMVRIRADVYYGRGIPERRRVLFDPYRCTESEMGLKLGVIRRVACAGVTPPEPAGGWMELAEGEPHVRVADVIMRGRVGVNLSGPYRYRLDVLCVERWGPVPLDVGLP